MHQPLATKQESLKNPCHLILVSVIFWLYFSKKWICLKNANATVYIKVKLSPTLIPMYSIDTNSIAHYSIPPKISTIMIFSCTKSFYALYLYLWWLVPARHIHFLYAWSHYMVLQNGHTNTLAQFLLFSKIK